MWQCLTIWITAVEKVFGVARSQQNENRLHRALTITDGFPHCLPRGLTRIPVIQVA